MGKMFPYLENPCLCFTSDGAWAGVKEVEKIAKICGAKTRVITTPPEVKVNQVGVIVTREGEEDEKIIFEFKRF